MPLKFSPNNAARSRPYIFGLKDQYLIYLVLVAISGLVISGNAALIGLPTLPFVVVFLVIILIGYFYFRKIDKKYDSGFFDRLLSYYFILPKRIKSKPIIHHIVSRHDKTR
jgi:hypothetical protein